MAKRGNLKNLRFSGGNGISFYSKYMDVFQQFLDTRVFIQVICLVKTSKTKFC